MRRWLTLAAMVGLAGLAAGCITPQQEPERDVFGVSAARPAAGNAAPDAKTREVLAWKISQLCTLGDEPVRLDDEAAEGGQQFVDQKLRCTPYQLSLPLVGTLPSSLSLPSPF